MIPYVLVYSDGTMKEHEFNDEKEAEWFIHNEGDHLVTATQELVYRLNKRAEIRRQIPTRKSVQIGERDRIAELLEEAACEIEFLRNVIKDLK